LENAIGNAVMMADKETIDNVHLPDEIRGATSEGRASVSAGTDQFVPDLNWTLEELEKHYIEYILELENGNVPKAAARLGVPRSTLYSRLKVIKQGN
jgi:DNA-binding NtrC family response regulator